MSMKTCKKCGMSKDETEFYSSKNACKECIREYVKAHPEHRNSKTQREWRRVAQRQARQEVLALLGGRGTKRGCGGAGLHRGKKNGGGVAKKKEEGRGAGGFFPLFEKISRENPPPPPLP